MISFAVLHTIICLPSIAHSLRATLPLSPTTTIHHHQPLSLPVVAVLTAQNQSPTTTTTKTSSSSLFSFQATTTATTTTFQHHDYRAYRSTMTTTTSTIVRVPIVYSSTDDDDEYYSNERRNTTNTTTTITTTKDSSEKQSKRGGHIRRLILRYCNRSIIPITLLRNLKFYNNTFSTSSSVSSITPRISGSRRRRFLTIPLFVSSSLKLIPTTRRKLGASLVLVLTILLLGKHRMLPMVDLRNNLTSSSSSSSSFSGKGWQRMRQRGRNNHIPLLPRDVHFDDEARAALTTVRNLYPACHHGWNQASSSTTTTTTTTAPETGSVDVLKEDSDGNGGRYSGRTVAVKQEDEKQQQLKLNKALEVLETTGGQNQATLTLRGYKGGKMEEQVNQDRAFVLSPFYFDDESGNDNDDDTRDLELLLESSSDDGSSSPSLSTTTTTIPDGTFIGAGVGRQKQRQPTNQLLGVFDGHAKRGELVSEYTARNLPKILASKLKTIHSPNSNGVAVAVSPSLLPSSNIPTVTPTTTTDTINFNPPHPPPPTSKTTTTTTTTTTIQKTKQALLETFLHLDQTAPAHPSGGCTASILLQVGSKLYVANTGDSRSILATYTKSTSTVDIVYISREDKPHVPEERARVEAMGGEVLRSNRVLVKPVVDSGGGGSSQRGFSLAMSRSIGDWEAAKVGVIPDPTIAVLDLLDLLEDGGGNGIDGDVEMFAVCATDGLLDFVDIKTVVTTIADSLYGEKGEGSSSPHLLSACESLITTAGMLWSKGMKGRYRDDISIAVSKICL